MDDNNLDFILHAAYAGAGEINQRGKKGGGKVQLSKTVGAGAKPRGARRKNPKAVRDDGLMLDGTSPPKLRVGASGFDHSKEMNNVEIRHTGINSAIPTYRQRNSRLEKLVPANEIPRGGTHRQGVPVGGFVSEQTRMEIAVDFPHWVTLRDSYMKQLSELTLLVSKGKIEVSDKPRRQQFLLLLLALRKVSIRIVSEYKFQAEMTIQTSVVEHKMAAKNIKAYIDSMPTCLDYLDCEPFITWIGARTRLNPLLHTRCLDSTESEIGESGLAYDLKFMNDSEFADCQEAGDVLWGIHYEDRKKQDKKLRSVLHQPEQRRNAAVVVDEEEQNEMDKVRREHQEHVIADLMTATESCLQSSTHSRDLKLFLLGRFFTKHAWKMWRKAYLIRVRIPVMDHARIRAILRNSFQALNKNVWQCIKYRGLQQHYNQRIMVITFDAWKEYLKWCRRFRKIHKKSINRVKGLFLRAMKRFTDDVYDVRRFRFNNAMRNKRICFKGFKSNVILCKYELKKRLELMSSASFVERHTCQRCFYRWVQRSRFVHKFDELEELVENGFLKAALIRWFLATRPVESNEPKLSFAERMKMRITLGGLRAAFTTRVESSEPDEEKRRQAAFQLNEAKRRARMKRAWEHSRKNGGEA